MRPSLSLSEHCYCQKSKEELLDKAVETAVAEGSYQDPYIAERSDSDSNSKDLYIRSFIIVPGVYNKRGWGPEIPSHHLSPTMLLGLVAWSLKLSQRNKTAAAY